MPYDHDDCQRRVTALRVAFSRKGETQAEFAKRFGAQPTTWNAWEKSPTQRISLDAAINLVEEIDGVTLDWIYLGDKSAVPFPVQVVLEEAEASLEPDLTKRSDGRGAGRVVGSTKSSSISRAKSRTRRA